MAGKIITTIMIMVFALTTAGFANEFKPPRSGQELGPGSAQGSDMGTSQKKMRHRAPKSPLDMLAKIQHDNIAVQVLSEITGQTAESIAQALQTQHMRELMESYNVDQEVFENAMDEKAIAFIGKAVENNSITQEQADEIIQMIENRPERPEPGTEPGTNQDDAAEL